jgi:excisionase family DNA binding protein
MAHEPTRWLTVADVAEILGTSTQTVRRMIKAGELPASRASAAPRASWLIDAAEFERQREADAERAAIRQRLGGVVSSYGDDEFIEKLRARYPDVTVGGPDGPGLAQDLRARIDRRDLLERVERDMYADPAIRQQLEQLDDNERFEQEARELARRIRRAEKLRDRAIEILSEEDDQEGAV